MALILGLAAKLGDDPANSNRHELGVLMQKNTYSSELAEASRPLVFNALEV